MCISFSPICHLPTEGGEIVTEEMSRENVNVSYLLGKERDIRLRVFPDTLGYFYYEVSIEDKEGNYNNDSNYSIDIGVSNEKTDNADEYFCKLDYHLISFYFLLLD